MIRRLIAILLVLVQFSMSIPAVAKVDFKSAANAESQVLQNRLIILPLVQEKGVTFNCGLWIQFLTGNLAIMHPGLDEFWFGWRVKDVFPTSSDFDLYCQKGDMKAELAEIATKIKVRYWLSGRVRNQGERIFAKFKHHDFAWSAVKYSPWFEMDLDNQLKGFSNSFLSWLGELIPGLSKEQIAKAIWPEHCSLAGIRKLENALHHYYIASAYAKEELNPGLFEGAVQSGLESYLATDLLGWAFYRGKDLKKADKAFTRAISLNPRGVGAMSGLFWCGVKNVNEEKALYWAKEKALARHQNPKTAKGSAMYWLGREAEKKKDFVKAAGFYGKAAAFNSQKFSYVSREVEAWLKARNSARAMEVIKAALPCFNHKNAKEKLLDLAEKAKIMDGQDK